MAWDDPVTSLDIYLDLRTVNNDDGQARILDADEIDSDVLLLRFPTKLYTLNTPCCGWSICTWDLALEASAKSARRLSLTNYAR